MGEGESHSADVIVSRPTRKARSAVGATLWAILAPMAFVAIGKAIAPGGPPPYPALWLLAVAIPGIVASLLWAKRGTGPSRARIAGRSLLLGDGAAEQLIARDAIASAYAAGVENGRERLDIELHSGERLALDYPAGEATRAIHALGLDPTRHVTRIPLYEPNARVVHSVAGVGLGLIGWVMLGSLALDMSPRGFFATALGAAIAVITTLPFMLAGYALSQNGLHHVVIGAEGLEYTFATFKGKQRRHLSFSEMAKVAIESSGTGRAFVTHVVAYMDSGEKVLVAAFPATTPPREAIAIRAAIEAARLRYAKSEAPKGLAWLEPSRDGTWLDELRKLARSEGNYRGMAMTRERLLEIVDDPRVTARHRLAAAFVLKERNDDEGVQRVRVAAETTASPRVRVALESIAEGRAEEAELVSAAEDEADAAETGARA